jgi:hypothetical protein
MPSGILARTQLKRISTTSGANCTYGSGTTARELTLPFSGKDIGMDILGCPE